MVARRGAGGGQPPCQSTQDSGPRGGRAIGNYPGRSAGKGIAGRRNGKDQVPARAKPQTWAGLSVRGDGDRRRGQLGQEAPRTSEFLCKNSGEPVKGGGVVKGRRKAGEGIGPPAGDGASAEGGRTWGLEVSSVSQPRPQPRLRPRPQRLGDRARRQRPTQGALSTLRAQCDHE